MALIDSASAGSKGNPNQNKKMPESKITVYDENPDLLNNAIFGAFSNYAESVRESNDCVEQQLLKNNIIIDTEELALIFKESYPDFSDNQIASLLKQVTPEVKESLPNKQLPT